MYTHRVGEQELSLKHIQSLLQQHGKIVLTDKAKAAIQHCRSYLDAKMNEKDALYYGINTGFGSLCNVKISAEETGTLQRNLVMSHACGTGDLVPQEIIQLMLLLKVESLSQGNSGVQVQTVQRLVEFFNEDVYPVVYTQGSLGASGDLAPLAHLCLPLLGLGEVWYRGERVAAISILEQFGWKAIELQSKEGLALLNGTQFMSAYGVHCLLEAHHLYHTANKIAAVSIDGFDCRLEPFNANIHRVRPHEGQVYTAANMLELLKDSAIARQEKKQVQDPYSFRCIPQVHGASKDVIEQVSRVFTTEINAVTDNPNVFPDEDLIISGGNFHGQPLALHLDFLAIALAELGNISERRTYLLISGQRGLPAFLVADAGLNSGFMIPQYTAAAIVSENKQLCSPASVDSIVSSNGQEDHVSMGANAAVKCLRVVNNLRRILGIELLNAAQALEFRRPSKSSTTVEEYVKNYRESVPFVEKDVVLHDLIQASAEFIRVN